MGKGYLDSYRLLVPINTSQDTQLWKAQDERRNRYVAIKTLTDAQLKNRKAASMIRWEYSIGAELNHPNVIKMLDFGVDDSRPYLVMEWFPHGNLKALIRQGVENYMPRVTQLAVSITEALAYFNSEGWVHRDVKPDNFMVDEEHNSVKLIDFAIAIHAQGFWARLFGGNSKVQGTRSYMSPEQIRGQALDQRADIYSLGCMLFELATGRLPFTGSNPNEILHKHLNVAPPSLESVNSNVTSEFSQLIRQTMAKKATDRPKTTAEFLAILKHTRIYKRLPFDQPRNED